MNFSRTCCSTFHCRGTTSSVSVTSSPSLASRVDPQHAHDGRTGHDDPLARQMLREGLARRLPARERAAPSCPSAALSAAKLVLATPPLRAPPVRAPSGRAGERRVRCAGRRARGASSRSRAADARSSPRRSPPVPGTGRDRPAPARAPPRAPGRDAAASRWSSGRAGPAMAMPAAEPIRAPRAVNLAVDGHPEVTLPHAGRQVRCG